jgi:flagellar biogenesis protein FliO
MSPRFLVLVLCSALTLCAHTDENKSPVPTLQEQAAPFDFKQPSLPPQELPFPTTPTPSAEELTDSYHGAFIRMLLSLVGLLVLLFGTFWFLKRMGRGRMGFGSRQSIQILEKRSLSPKSVLYIVEIEGKKILLSESQLEVRALSEIAPEIEEV